jgi:hypothetical protein
MPEYIGKTKGFGTLANSVSFNTYVPELSDNADIQNAFELFYFGDSSFGTTTGDVSLHASLVDFDSRINSTTSTLSGHIGASEAHEATGGVVGATKAQELTNKTLTAPKINENVALTATSTELNVLDGITSSTAELNILDGVTSTAAELNILDGVTATAAELNILDGITASTTELNYVDGVTSAIQTQINLKPTLTYEGTPLNRNIFVQTAQPTAVNIGDIWFDF